MLRWQLREWHKLSLKNKVLVISVAGHLTFLFLLFFIYKDPHQQSITIRTNFSSDIPVIYVPLLKSSNSLSQIVSGKCVVTATKPVPSVSAPAIKKNEQKAGLVTLPKKIEKKITSEKSTKKKAKQTVQAKTKNEVKQNKKPPTKELANKQLAQKESSKAELKPAGNKPTKTDQKELISKEIIDQNVQVQSGLENQTPIIIGQNEQEALEIFEHIQTNLQQNWKPPSSISKETECTIAVNVDGSGNITQIECTKTSGVLLFDGAAQKAVSQLQFPKIAYGRQIIIIFKP